MSEKPRTPSETRQMLRDAQLEWLDELTVGTGKSLSRIALDSGLADTTLTQFRRGKHNGVLQQAVVQRVSEKTGIFGPGIATTVRSMREDGVPLREDHPEREAVDALLRGREAARAWVVKSDVLSLAGVRSSDIIIVDASLTARDGDIVSAEIEAGLGRRTVFRLYQQPLLVGAGLDPLAVRPEQVDGVRVSITGVMTNLLRTRS